MYPSCVSSALESGRTVKIDEWEHSGKRETVERIAPSSAAGAAHGAFRAPSDSLFDADYGSAAARGVDVHAGYEQIGWVEDPGEVPEAFREAFVKPSEDARLWRERSYELFENGRWHTGQFDRVVFTGKGESAKAVIYDFKTNLMMDCEDEERFAERMLRTYAPQMGAYKMALSRLTGISLDSIDCRLLVDNQNKIVIEFPA
jgi:hypothetical protein